MGEHASGQVPPATTSPEHLERYRRYLMVLARGQVAPRLRERVDLSGVVQQTFLEAHEQRAQFRGFTEAERAGWLRRILARNLTDALRSVGRAKRDAARERSLEAALEESSCCLGSMLAADHPSPAQQAQRHERAVMLAEALEQLPEAQREALVLQHWEGWTLAEIGAHMGRSPAAVAGLLKRGLQGLRELLREGGKA